MRETHDRTHYLHERINKIDNDNHRDQTNDSHVWLVDQLRKSLNLQKTLTQTLEECRPRNWRSYIDEEKLKKILDGIEKTVDKTLEHVKYLNNDNRDKNI